MANASIRLWILGMALGCFAAGMVIGSVCTKQVIQGQASPEPEHPYVEGLVANYGLSAAQTRSLQIVLQAERAEEQALRLGIGWNDLPAGAQAQLLAARARTRQRILALLDPQQRAAFERASEPVGASPTGGTASGAAGAGRR